MKYNSYEVGPVLRRLRKDRHYTVEAFSEKTGISPSTIKQMEQGGRNLSMRNLYVMMDVLDVDANTILGLDDRKDNLSIDKKLNQLDDKRRAYLTESFLFMLDHAVGHTLQKEGI